MTSTWFNWLLVVEYLAVASWCFYERNYLKAYYWLSGASILTSVALMK